MRIKKYQNWKLSSSHHGSIFNPNRQKTTDIFSISQLLETPKKSLHTQDEHQYIFTDPKALNHSFNLNRRILNKKDIQINQFIKPSTRTEREQIIKNKIKERIKEEFANQNFIQSTKGFFNYETPINYPITNLQGQKFQHQQGRVYIKGNSVAFNSVQLKKRSKSSLLKTSHPNFNKKQNFTKYENNGIRQKQHIFKHKFYSVQMKRKNSSCLISRQKTMSCIKKKHSLKDIQPWQIDDGPQIFEM